MQTGYSEQQKPPHTGSRTRLLTLSKSLPDKWVLGTVLIAGLASIPLIVVSSSIFLPGSDVWQHLYETVLTEYIVNSIILMIGVGLLTFLMGVSTAWLTSMCDFPGRSIFQWLLLLPLAIPAYIIAFTYTGLFESAGPVQSLIRAWTGLAYGQYWFPEIRSLPGAIMMLSLVLYPYVFMLTRAALLEQSVCVLEVSKTLGCGPWRCFFRVALPLARPSIAIGLALVLMETLADYGTVQYFGVSTFTTGIFRTWFGLNDATAAMQLAVVMLFFVFSLLAIERRSRRKQRFHHTSTKYSTLTPYRLTGNKAVIAFILCVLPVTFGFLLPAGQLLAWGLENLDTLVTSRFLNLFWHSIWLAGITAIIAIAIALFVGYAQRSNPDNWIKLPIRVASMGYAIPGVVIAVGVMIPFAWFDNHLSDFLKGSFDIETGLLLSNSVFILIFAYLVRFLSISIQSVEAGLGKIKTNMDDAARALKARPIDIVRKIHLPVMRGSLLTALLLVFVDVLKELPATLVLRPFDFNTLAIHAYELASDERLSEASIPSLAIVVAGLIPVIILNRSISQSRPGHNKP